MVGNVGNFCDAIATLRCSQIGASLLRHCSGACKVVHVLKCFPPEDLGCFPQQIDRQVITAFQNLTGIPLSAPMIAQLHLPVRLGGFGYLSVEVISPSLYVAATLRYALFGARTIGAPTELGIASVRMQGELDMLAVKYPVLRAQVALLFQQWNVEQLCKLVDHEKWSEPIHKYQFQTLVDSSAARDRVRLLCLQNSYSGAWLNICPSAAGWETQSLISCVA